MVRNSPSSWGSAWLIRAAILMLLSGCLIGAFDAYDVRLLTLTAIFGILALGQSIAFGLAGQLLLCQGAFFGVAAYGSAILAVRLHVPVPLAAFAAALLTVLFGLVVGWVSARTSGHYLAMVTLAVAVIVYELALNWNSLTNGALGLGGIPRPVLGGSFLDLENDKVYLVFCVIALWLAMETFSLLRRSRQGTILLALREDELAASSLGIGPARTKGLAIVWAAAFAGVAGPLYAHFQRLISPEDFTFFHSVMLLLIVVVGGRDSVAGPVMGAALVLWLPEQLRGMEEYRWILFGAALVFCIVFLPGGVWGGVSQVWQRLYFRRRGSGA